MKRLIGLIAAALLVTCAVSSAAIAAVDPKPATNDFILRAPAAEVDGIASRNGLTVVGTIDTPVDPEGRSVYLVRAASSTPPELVIQDIRTLEPTAAGIEEVFLASLPELDQSAMVILDSSNLEEALEAAEAVRPPSGSINASWVADTPDRQIENETKDLRATFELDAGADPLQYGLQVNFEDGTSALWDGTVEVGPVRLHPRLDLDSNKADWWITNLGSSPVTIDGLEITWPAVNDVLKKIKLDGGTIYDPDLPPASASVSSGWSGDVLDRQIPAGETFQLRFEFEEDVDLDVALYDLEVEFAEGHSQEFDPVDSSCGAVFHFGASFSSSEARFEVTNTRPFPITLDVLDLDWPAGNGDLLEVKLGGKLIWMGDKSPPRTLDGGWLGLPADLQIKEGTTEELKLKYALPPASDPLAYSVAMTFSAGYFAAFDPADQVCPETLVHAGADFHNEKVEWRITSRSGEVKTVATVDLGWPEANGILLSLELKGKELQREIVREFGEHPDGTKRYVWQPYMEQPATQLLEVDSAQSTFKGEATVAIIDTGIDPDHPLLADRVVPGYDFVNDLPGGSERLDVDQSAMVILDQSAMVILDQSAMVILDGSDLVPLNQSAMVILDEDQQQDLDLATLPPAFGHGTMVAGIIHRVAPEASLMPLKAFDANGNGNLYDIVEAIYYAVDNGANVINMSFSLNTFSPELMRAVNYAARKGVSCVASAGNTGEETLVFPASFGNTLGVAATNAAGELSSFSNWGSDLVTVSAPGENILTTFPGGGWALASGTSFAAPWISGAAAVFADKLGKKHNPGRADYYLSSNALSDTDPVSGSGQGKSGHGRANLRKAVDRVKSGRYAAERPLGEYTISVTFAEGCTASYPPPSSGSGCEVEGASQLRFNGKTVLWDLENEGLATVSIDSVSVVWEAVNGALKKIELDGSPFYDYQQHAPTSAVIDSNWHSDATRREIPAGEELELKLEFAENVIWTY